MYLKELVDIQMGQSPDSKFYNYDKIGLPFYQGKADFGRINPTPKIWCSKSKKEAKLNDILISVRAPVGDLNINNEQSCIGRGLAAITCKSDVDMMYLYYHLKYLKPQLRQISTGSTFESINRSQLENLIIVYKPYSEQIKISNILQVVQRQIEVKEKLLRLYDLLIKSRFVELFGDVVLNTLNWPLVKLSDIAEYRIGLTYKPEVLSSSGIAVLRSGNIQNSQLCYDDTIYVNSKVESKLLLKKNDILMCARNGSQSLVGKVALIENDISNTTYGAFMMAISSKYYVYLFEYFRSQAFRRLISVGSTTTINQITTRMLNSIVIPLPDMDTIHRFALYHSQINKLKSDVRKSIDETQLLMDSLMQEYFG